MPSGTSDCGSIGSDRINAGLKSRDFESLASTPPFILTKAKGHSPLPSRRIPLHPCRAILLFPEIPTAYYPKTEWQTRWIVWNGPDAFTLERLGYLRQDSPIIHDSLQAVSQAHKRLESLMTQEDLAAVLERKNIVLELVRRLFLMSRGKQQTGVLNEQMEEAVEFLRRSFNKEFSIEDLAHRFACSATHFRRTFHAYTGRSPREFITSLRISQAKELLMQGKSIKQTAQLVGYQDVLYFLRFSKKQPDSHRNGLSMRLIFTDVQVPCFYEDDTTTKILMRPRINS